MLKSDELKGKEKRRAVEQKEYVKSGLRGKYSGRNAKMRGRQREKYRSQWRPIGGMHV
jgi:hypothetical protein